MVRISLVSVLVTLTLASVTPVAMALPGIGDAMKGVMPGAEKSAERMVYVTWATLRERG